MPKLTAVLIRQLQPRVHAYIVFDRALPTFGVRVYPSGAKSYLIQYRLTPGRRGRQTSEVIGSCRLLTLQHARAMARQRLAELRLARHEALFAQARVRRRGDA